MLATCFLHGTPYAKAEQLVATGHEPSPRHVEAGLELLGYGGQFDRDVVAAWLGPVNVREAKPRTRRPRPVRAERLYVVVRRDLAPGHQMVQAIHAAQTFAVEHAEEHLAWFKSSNTLAVLTVSGLAELRRLHGRAVTAGLACSLFTEPDMGDAPTALVLPPAGRQLCKRLPLALATEVQNR